MGLDMPAASNGLMVLGHLLQQFLVTPLPVTTLESLVAYSLIAVREARALNPPMPGLPGEPPSGRWGLRTGAWAGPGRGAGHLRSPCRVNAHGVDKRREWALGFLTRHCGMRVGEFVGDWITKAGVPFGGPADVFGDLPA
jgi:hypothetical protein